MLANSPALVSQQRVVASMLEFYHHHVPLLRGTWLDGPNVTWLRWQLTLLLRLSPIRVQTRSK